MTQKDNDNTGLPHDLRAEASIIGCLLVPGSDAYDDVLLHISAASFYDARNRMIFEAVEALINRNVAIDSITIKDELTRRGRFEEVGGLAYMIECVNKTASLVNAKDYAKIVKSTYQLRQLVLALQSSIVKVSEWEEAEATALVAECENLILDATDDDKQEDATPLVDLLAPFYETVERKRANPGVLGGLSTGLKDLDEILDGLHKGDLALLAGRPSMGKSAAAVQFADSACRAGGKVLFFSAEMSDDQIMSRFAGLRSGLSLTGIQKGRLTDEEMATLGKALASMSEYQLELSGVMDVDEICSNVRRKTRVNGVDLVIIDHVGYVQTIKEYNNRTQQLSAISKKLKAMAHKENVPVVLLSQLSRRVEQRSDKRPMLSDLRDSGTLEEDADVVMLLFRDSYYDPDAIDPNTLEINVAKQRNGPVTTVRVYYSTGNNVFRDLELRALDDLNF